MKSKHCARCGRLMTHRKQWANNWDAVKYCSKTCRTHRVQAVDVDLELAIVDLLVHRSGSSTIRPSEAAQVVGGEQWKSLVERSRMAARRLVHRGVVDIIQNNKRVDVSTAKGPIEIRRGPQFLMQKQ